MDELLELENAKSSAQNLITEVETALIVNTDTISQAQRASLDVALNSLKSACEGDDIESINNAMTLLQNLYSNI